MGAVHPVPGRAGRDRVRRAAVERAGDHHAVPHPGDVRQGAVPRRRRRPAHAAGVAGRRDDRGAGGDRADRRLPDLADHAAGQPGDGRPARAAVRAPAAHGPGVLHRDAHRGDPVAAGQRRRRRAVGAVGDGELDPGQRRHGGRRAGGDGAAVVAADDRRGRAGAAVRRAAGAGRAGAAGARRPHAGVALGHDRDHPGVAVGVRRAAGEGVQPAGRRGAPLQGRERPPGRPAGPPGHDRAVVLRGRADVPRGDARRWCTWSRASSSRPGSGGGDHGGHDRRVHHAADPAAVPDGQPAAGLAGRADLARAVRADLRLPRPGAAHRRRARRPGARRRPSPVGVEFEHVWFAYPSARASDAGGAVRDVSFVVEPGQLAAIVGPSGSGQDHAVLPGAAALRRRPRPGA